MSGYGLVVCFVGLDPKALPASSGALLNRLAQSRGDLDRLFDDQHEVVDAATDLHWQLKEREYHRGCAFACVFPSNLRGSLFAVEFNLSGFPFDAWNL